jgi:hypothetical protein
VEVNFFSEYKNFEIVRDGRRFCFVRHKLSQKNVISFVLSGCKYDVLFGGGAYNQYLLSEALRMLEFLNKTVATDNNLC